ncbi:hypothetical protein [Lysobacter xanthus]
MNRRTRVQVLVAFIAAATGVVGAYTALEGIRTVARVSAIASAFGAGASLAAGLAILRRHRG